MGEKTFYRIVAANGTLSADAFVVACPQPESIKAGCVLVVNQRNLTPLAVHETQLVPAKTEWESPHGARQTSTTARHSPCLRCGRVKGMVQDQVTCPFHGDRPCAV